MSMRRRASMATRRLALSDVKLTAHRAGLPGKEAICFFIAPLIPAYRAGLKGLRSRSAMGIRALPFAGTVRMITPPAIREVRL